jgi:SAM-dependent methyltransferase
MDARTEPQAPVSDPETHVHRVHFFPPLFEQRRAWILDVLRGARPRVSSILDIGCGEGTLLAVLCQPAECLPLPDEDADANDGRGGRGDADVLRSVLDTVESMHPRVIAGLDVSPHVLDLARSVLEAHSGGYAFLPPRPRWLSLDVRLWRGTLEVFNAALVGFDCIVASEVCVPRLTAEPERGRT